MKAKNANFKISEYSRLLAVSKMSKLFKWRSLAFATETRSPIPFAEYSAVIADPDDSLTIYISSKQNGIFRTTDGGDTWQHTETMTTDQPPFGKKIAVELFRLPLLQLFKRR